MYKRKKCIHDVYICAPIHKLKLVGKKIPDAAMSQNTESAAFGSKKIPDTRILHPGKNCQSFSSNTVSLHVCFHTLFYPKTTEKLKKCQSVQYFFQFRSLFQKITRRPEFFPVLGHYQKLPNFQKKCCTFGLVSRNLARPFWNYLLDVLKSQCNFIIIL